MLAKPYNSFAGTADEYQVKAAFLGHFSHFITWPEHDSNKSLELCVFAPITRQAIFELLSSKNVKRLRLRYYTKMTQNAVTALSSCNLLFFTKDFSSIQYDIMQNMKLNPVLTVGETMGFARAGGIIEFRVERKKVRFSINLGAAKAKKLFISSRLLRLADIVVTEETMESQKSIGGTP